MKNLFILLSSFYFFSCVKTLSKDVSYSLALSQDKSYEAIYDTST